MTPKGSLTKELVFIIVALVAGTILLCYFLNATLIEKYYIYLNDEEVGILERMLEDCKRRKREYALDED